MFVKLVTMTGLAAGVALVGLVCSTGDKPDDRSDDRRVEDSRPPIVERKRIREPRPIRASNTSVPAPAESFDETELFEEPERRDSVPSKERPRDATKQPARTDSDEPRTSPPPIPTRSPGRHRLIDDLTLWFAEHDLDNDGRITLSEWLSDGNSATEFRRIDLDGDDFLSFEELAWEMTLMTRSIIRT